MKKGSITIYLSLVLVSVLLLISVIIESARMNVVQSESKSFTYLAADSVLAGYARQVYEDYGILLVWEDKVLKEQLIKYLQANIDLADLNIGGTNIMATRVKGIKINKVDYVAKNGGEEFIDQVMSYMKYALVTETVDELIDLYSNNIDNQRKDDTTEYMTNVNEEKSSKISKIVEEINNDIASLKEEDINKKLITKKKRVSFINKINKILEKIEDYQKEKKEFLNKETEGDDYIDSNFNILEQIKNKIKGEELIDSSDDKERWKHIGEEVNKRIEDLKVKIATEEDEKNKGIYESAKKLLEKSILSLVIDDTSNISSASISDSNLPSKKGYSKSNVSHNTIEKAKLIMYGGLKFGNYQSLLKKSNLNYEMEYIISGKDNDRSNLTNTVEQMVAVRNIVTLAYLITDETKMSELSAISASATTAIGLPFLEPAIKGVLTEAWALAEAINDVRILMAGEKISITKNNENWNTKLMSLFDSKIKGTDKKASINYQQFCYLLMMKENINILALRMLDVIHINVKKNYNGQFDANKCFSGFSMEAQYEAAPLFVSMPWTINQLGQNIGAYSFSIQCNAGF